MKKKIKLNTETIRILVRKELPLVEGGGSLDCTIPTKKTSMNQVAAC